MSNGPVSRSFRPFLDNVKPQSLAGFGVDEHTFQNPAASRGWADGRDGPSPNDIVGEPTRGLDGSSRIESSFPQEVVEPLELGGLQHQSVLP